MPPLLADFTHARPCKPFCEKYLTLPSGASVYLMLWSDMETVSIPLKFFVYGNPMYYWMNFSSCRTMGIIEHLPFYFIGCISLLIVGGLIMIRKEIK